MIYRSLLFISASCSIGYALVMLFYWRQMHATVPFINIVLDAPHIMLTLAIVGFILSLF